ncbi:type III pantothenate kinase [Methylomonas sp. UP202]|uniref:type III pantothenate kinase n=1 Tax=Methylomonas sp. UP202 TaxID=3040943 RepID=UPI0024790F7D|nr:type III pantothenate kinase [Methylomonas sp. UP202]WGS88185.1 type III pantothenate kinase [Methylomonas sp. UP202]
MILLVDLGNSRLKWALAVDGKVGDLHAVDYRQAGFAAWLRRQWQIYATPDCIGVAAVGAPAVLDDVLSVAQSLWRGVAIVKPLSTASSAGVVNAYRFPDKLGIDRWLALLAARRDYPGQWCVVDCGTAITLDLLSEDGRHQGGLIAPGVSLMKGVLAFGTEVLPLVERQADFGLGMTTEAAIDSGVLSAAIGLIEATLIRHPHYRLLMCGGDAELLQGLLTVEAVVDVKLVLKGLLICCEAGRR